MAYATNGTTPPAGGMPPTYGGQDAEWWRDALDWIGGLFSGCAKSNPATWQEHIITRCLGGKRWDGTPCPGSPDPRRAALAARRDPAGAKTVADRLRANNEGWAPTVADMGDPHNAILWVFAAEGGLDCINSGDPGQGTAMRSWVLAQTPDWEQPSTPPPDPSLPVESQAWWENLAQNAQAAGEDAVQAIVVEAARRGYSALPDNAKKALAALGLDYYGGGAAGAAQAALPWLIGGGIVLALARRRT